MSPTHCRSLRRTLLRQRQPERPVLTAREPFNHFPRTPPPKKIRENSWGRIAASSNYLAMNEPTEPAEAAFREQMRTLARRGGNATRRKTQADPTHYREIGRMGGRASAAARRRRCTAALEQWTPSGAPIVTPRKPAHSEGQEAVESPEAVDVRSRDEDAPTVKLSPQGERERRDELLRREGFREAYCDSHGVNPTGEQMDEILGSSRSVREMPEPL